jgi:SAM-dependent methyltransferase
MLIRNFLSLADILFEKFKPAKNDLIIDIGSNDGTLLQGFKEKGMRVLGIEPTDAAKVANKNKIPTLQEFFNKNSVEKITKKYGEAKFVTATNVFAHINDTGELIKNVRNLLSKDGVFISESQYLLDIVEKFEFDTIYHEHLRFYSLKPLIKLHELGGMSVIDAERISAAGGSIRVYAKRGKHPMSERVKQLIAEEEKAGLYSGTSLNDFAKRVIEAKHNLLALLLKCKLENKKIVGVGSPARSNTMLGFSNIDSNILDYAFEKTGSPKIGLYTPGTHIPVVDEKQFFVDQPDYALVLSWHIGEELMQKLRASGYKGKFIMPLPVPRIIN